MANQKKKRGPKSKIHAIRKDNWSAFDEAYRALRVGLSRKDVAPMLGISENTFYLWMQRGAAGQKYYDEFYEKVCEAERQVKITCTTSLVRAALKGDWRAGLAFLERKFPGEWAQHINVKQGAMDIDLSALSDEELDHWIALTEKTEKK
jgi:hypothetical protein